MSYLDKKALQVVGTRPIRPDGVDKVTGRANFGADMTMPGMLWGRIKRSPHAHARIVSINTENAQALPGVRAVITRADFPDITPERAHIGAAPHNLHDMSLNCMAKGKVLYEGHPVAAVAATSQLVAEQALDLIEVEFEILPHVMDVEAAMAEDAPLLHDNIFTAGIEPKPEKPSNIAKVVRFAKGDVEAGFEEADVVIERRYTTKPVHQGYIEPHACLVSVGADGQTIIYSSSQGQFMVRGYTARICGADIANIRAIPAEIGGGFGGKTIIYLEPLAYMLSKKSGRPVKIVMSREEVFRTTGPTSGAVVEVRLGAKRDGHITAAQSILKYQAGAFPRITGAAGLHLRDGGLRLPERPDGRLRRGVQQAEGRGVPRAGRADRVVRIGKLRRRTSARIEHRSASDARHQWCQRRRQVDARRHLGQHRLSKDAGGRACQRTYAGRAEAQPGTRHCLGLLAQCWR
jgi:CO/xanthine dehydrogenase Mo-binding subunit